MDEFARALLAHPSSRDPKTGVLPAQVTLGRQVINPTTNNHTDNTIVTTGHGTKSASSLPSCSPSLHATIDTSSLEESVTPTTHSEPSLLLKQ